MSEENSTPAQARAEAARAVFATIRAVVGSQPRVERLGTALAGPQAARQTRGGAQAQRASSAAQDATVQAQAQAQNSKTSTAGAWAATAARAEP